MHATTVATNAILERRGARTGFITTEGFRDVLELRRIRIPLAYDLGWKKPEPLVERAVRLGVRERLDAQGGVLTPLDMDDVDAAIDELQTAEIETVAVCSCTPTATPAMSARSAPGCGSGCPACTCRCRRTCCPEMLEFERTSTTVVNAYIAPLIARYLDRLRGALAECGVRAPILVMQSNGGLISASSATARPVTIIELGPAAGVVAAQRMARACGYPNVITLDMGGTTTKASIIESGEILRGTEYEVGSAVSVSSRLMRGNGYLLRIPVIDISEVGAGGGSIAALDAGGSLRVGPRSAGAVPGPACYGHGNEQPTVTDANLLLGYISDTSLAGGALAVDRALAEAAVRRHVSAPSSLSLLDAAHGIHAVANSNMVRAIKSVSVERGRDPADFVMMAFGGAGPIHAAGVARTLGIRKVLVPQAPGVFSALGLLRAEIEHHAARTVLMGTGGAVDLAPVERALDEMRNDLRDRVREEGFDPATALFEQFADLRYRGQSSELTVPMPAGPLDVPALRAIEERFEQEFERTYGHRGDTKAFELVTVRLVMRVPRAVEHGADWAPERAAPDARRAGVLRSGARPARHGRSARQSLGRAPRAGPLLVQEYDTTIVVPPGCDASLDDRGNVVIGIGA